MVFPELGDGAVDPRWRGDWCERAERRARAGLLLGALARLEGVSIGDEEIDAKLQAIAEETGKHIAKVKVEYQGERRSQLENELLEERLVVLLTERATVHDAPQPAVEDDGASGEDAGGEEAATEGESAPDGNDEDDDA